MTQRVRQSASILKRFQFDYLHLIYELLTIHASHGRAPPNPFHLTHIAYIDHFYAHKGSSTDRSVVRLSTI